MLNASFITQHVMTNFPLLTCKVHPRVLVVLLVQSEEKNIEMWRAYFYLVNDKLFSRSCYSLLSRLTVFYYTDTDETYDSIYDVYKDKGKK